MKFNQLNTKAIEIFRKYNQLNKTKGRSAWHGQDVMAGFVGDVGELSKIIMAKQNLRDIENIDEKLAHELSDCLWSIMVLANIYEIDIEEAFINTMNSIEKKINSTMPGY